MPTVRPTMRLLAEDEVDRVIGEACRVLADTGVIVEGESAVGLLGERGGRHDGGRVRIPEAACRAALATVPARVALYDRAGALALDLGGDRVHFDPGSAAIRLYDLAEGRERPPTSSDAIDFARLVDSLPGFAAQSTAIVPGDVPASYVDRWRLYLVLRHARKPIVTGTLAADGFSPMHAMLAAVRGGARALAERPLAIFDCCPTSPLKWSALTSGALVACAQAGVPATLVSMPLAGATAPVTLRDTVVQHCAECLSGVVLHQAAAPGAPLLWGTSAAAFDMRQGSAPLGAIETMMLQVAIAEVGKRLGLPTHAYLGLSDAKVPDYQAGFETAMGALLAVLAGVNLVSGAGMLDYEMTQSFEKLLLDHDVCQAALRLGRGVAVSGADAAPLIAEVATAASFLSHPHTRAHWREELHIPSPLVDRLSYGDWVAAGARWAHTRAAEALPRQLSGAGAPDLPADVSAELQRIITAEVEAHRIRHD